MPAYRANFALPLDELRDEIDRLWTSLVTAPPLHGWSARTGQGTFPAVNVRETDAAVVVEAELPGIDPASLEVSVAGEELLLKGSRPAETGSTPDTCCGGSCGESAAATGERGRGDAGRKEVWHLRERGSGAFERRLTLPVPVDATKVEARLVDGVLTVDCPKLAECQPRKVPVRGA